MTSVIMYSAYLTSKNKKGVKQGNSSYITLTNLAPYNSYS